MLFPPRVFPEGSAAMASIRASMKSPTGAPSIRSNLARFDAMASRRTSSRCATTCSWRNAPGACRSPPHANAFHAPATTAAAHAGEVCLTHPPCTAPETCRPQLAGTASAPTNGSGS